jgi:predicted DNA-binding transcriptional regulator AlpA
MPTDHPTWLSFADLAARLGLSVGTVKDWRAKGYGPPGVILGRRVRFHLDDVVAWEQSQRETATR